jgi:hypothetical protein
VSFAGSVFDAGDFVCASLRERVRAAAPQADVRPPVLPPIGGAFCLGMEGLGAAVGDAVLARLRVGLAETGL